MLLIASRAVHVTRSLEHSTLTGSPNSYRNTTVDPLMLMRSSVGFVSGVLAASLLAVGAWFTGGAAATVTVTVPCAEPPWPSLTV